MSVEENLRMVHEELVDLHQKQQDGIDLIYNKFNWILVSDVVLLAALYNSEYVYSIVLILITFSAVIAIFGFESRTFKVTERITDQLERIESSQSDFLKKLAAKKREAFNANNKQILELSLYRQYSGALLLAALALQAMFMIY